MIETNLCTFEKLDDGIILQRYKFPCHVDLEVAKTGLAAIKSLAEKQPVLLCADITFVKGASVEARALGASEEFFDVIRAIGMATDSKVARVVGNFFVRFNRPRYPSKLFNTEELAQQWLRSLR